MENLFNVNQVAYILKVHPLTIRRYLKDGRLKAVRVGGSVRIPESQLQAFTKEFAPKPREHVIGLKRQSPAVSFSSDDPLLRLEGRGASVQFQPPK